ncbi:ascorbate 6-phosphate lactonase, partial [Streptococcus suis]
ISPDERKRLEKEFLLAKERIEYHIAECMAKGFEDKFHVAYDDVEISIIAMLLLSFRKDKDSHNYSSDFDAMREVIKSFLDAFEK